MSRWLGILLGVLVLGAILLLAVGLPRLTGSSQGAVSLPGKLPGGLVAVAEVTPPEGAVQDPEAFQKSQQDTIDYIEKTYDDVYEHSVAFQAYTDEQFQRFVTVTVYDAPGGAFGPPQGFASAEAQGQARPATELLREGEAICVANWQQQQAGTPPQEDDVPAGLSCQQSDGERTVQLATTGETVQATAELLDQVVTQLQ